MMRVQKELHYLRENTITEAKTAIVTHDKVTRLLPWIDTVTTVNATDVILADKI